MRPGFTTTRQLRAFCSATVLLVGLLAMFHPWKRRPFEAEINKSAALQKKTLKICDLAWQWPSMLRPYFLYQRIIARFFRYW